jgi:hypothetical protein
MDPVQNRDSAKSPDPGSELSESGSELSEPGSETLLITIMIQIHPFSGTTGRKLNLKIYMRT